MMKKTSRWGLWLALLLMAIAAGNATANPEETQKLIGVLQSDAGLYEKGVACRLLASKGDPASIPALASLLADDALSHLARFGLEPMPDPAAGAALRAAMETLQGPKLVGVINSVGMRQDAEATAKLIELLSNADPAVASAAGAALSQIANPPAVAALAAALAAAPAPLKIELADASVACAETLIKHGKSAEAIAIYDSVRGMKDLPVQSRQAALQGAILTRKDAGAALLTETLEGTDLAMVVVALRAARMLPGASVTAALSASLGKLPVEKQVLLIQALGDRGDAAALPALSGAAENGAPEVRLAAVRVLGRLGNASAIPLLFKTATGAEGELATAALTGLTTLPGQDVDAAIVAALSQGDPKLRGVAITVASQRQIKAAVPVLLTAAKDPDAETRRVALGALKNIAGPADLGALVEIMTQASSKQERSAAQSAVAGICVRAEDKEACAGPLLAALPQASPEAKVALLELLAQVGGVQSLAAVRAASAETQPQVRETALRALCAWLTPDVLPDLAALSANAPDPTIKILALRGQYRLIPQMQAPAGQKLKAIQGALAQTERSEEKYLALSALAQIPTAESLNMVATHLDDPALQEEAAIAAVAISGQIVETAPAAVAAAMRKVKTADNKLMGEARKLQAKADAAAPASAPAPVASAAGQSEKGFVPLFDGKSLAGWEGDPAIWSVENGVIVAKANMIKANNFLSTKQEYGDFVLRVQVKLVDQKGNTGIQFRSIKIPDTPSMAGFQADFAEVVKYCGMLYDEKRRGILLQPKPETIKVNSGDWNDIEVRANGDRIQIKLNGVQTINYTETAEKDAKTGQEIWKKGFIGLQAHAGTVMEVQFKNIRIRELKKR